MTPLDENPNCEEAHATFRLVGDQLRVEEATRRLGINPDFEAAKDEIRRSRMRRRAVRQPTGVWYVSTAGKLSTTSVERHLCWLLELIEPAGDELHALCEEQDLSADFGCYWVSATGHGGPDVSSETLRRIADLGASLGFDFYGPWGDDEEPQSDPPPPLERA